MAQEQGSPPTKYSPVTVRKSLTSPKLKTAPIKIGLLNTLPDTTRKILAIASMLRVLLASYQDVKNCLPNCKIKAENGSVFIKITWSGYWLDFENGHLMVAELEKEK